jgi:hypothetical protein
LDPHQEDVRIEGEVASTGIAAGLFGGTGFAVHFALLLLSVAAALGLAEIMAIGFAFLIMGLVYVVLAGVLFVLGRKRLATVKVVPPRTVGTLKEVVAWAKQQKS